MSAQGDREALAQLVQSVSLRFGGPHMAEFGDNPPIRKHYAIADAVLKAGFRRSPVPPEVDEGLDSGYTPREHEARARFIAGSIEIIRRRDGHTPGEAEDVAAAEWDRWRSLAAVPPVTEEDR